MRINIKPSYIFSVIFSGAFALIGSFGPLQAKTHEANLVSVAVPEANKKNSKQKKTKNIKATKSKKTVKKATKKTVKNSKAVKKVITVKTPVLKKGDDAINQSSYCPRYNRAKSTYLYRTVGGKPTALAVGGCQI